MCADGSYQQCHETYIQTIITGAIIVCAVVLSNINNIRRR